jgi:predicted RNA-binding Zn-ribbon protein involved in translation (DUF1610 family)
MDAKRSVAIKGGRTMDGAFGFSLSIGLGLILFISGLVISIAFSDESSIGLLFGIPMIIAGVILPLFMMRDTFANHDVVSPCPACGSKVNVAENMMQFDCPECGSTLRVRGGQLFTAE